MTPAHVSAEAPAGPAPVRLPASTLVPVAAAFLASGAAALVYQVAWQRILALQSGVGIYSVAAIVAAFMLGLGAGSYYGGRLTLRLSARAALFAFAVVELAVSAWGALSCWLYYDVLYLRAAWLYSPLGRAALVHLVVLLPPTFLMGMSLPLLARATVLDARTAGRTLGVLYGLNLVGAAAGAVLAPWVLIRFYGIQGATLAAAAANLFAAVAGLAAGLTASRAPEAVRAEAGLPAPVTAAEGASLRMWVLLYALSGFCALSLEIIWFRLLDVALKSNAFTFGTLLGVYLLGSAVGCLAMAGRADRVARPLPAFLLLQCGLIGYAGLGALLLAEVPPGTSFMRWYEEYWSFGRSIRFGTRWEWESFLRLYVALPLALFGPPTVMMGASFPLLQRAVQDDPASAGRKVGLLQAANIAGCVAGSLAVGLFALGHIGTTGALRLLMGGGLVFAVLGMRAGSRRVFGALAALLAAVIILLPGQRGLWMRLHARPESSGMVAEDATGLAAVIAAGEGSLGVYVNGKHHSVIPFGGVHTRLGAAPAIVHPAPLDVAIIGLGSGDTAWAAGCRPETRTLTVFEISGGQPPLLSRVAAEGRYPSLTSFLADPRLRIVIEDGRRGLQAAGRRYDVIEADALWPTVAYAGNLYSVEFFQMCARRLRPGGILCTWAPTPRVYSSFVTALPHVIGLGDREILLGSNEPIEIDREAWAERLQSVAVRAYLGDEAVASTQWMLDRLRPLHRTGRHMPERQRNRDLFPRDEFVTP
ncbi:MAG TPA: fused MFS/spermidine synthase [Vicinamibacteria bacterium]|nr:fused MFS/spermidine synthase [Vicinamibacteria bacterium]